MLEARTFLSVTQDANGWTVITPSADSHVIYVSSSQGNDSNTGRSADKPVATLGKASSLLRDNSSDEMLLKRGDVWDNQSFDGWFRSGKSAQEPMVIGAYGTGDRPLIDSGASSGFSAGKSSTADTNYVDIVGIHFSANTRLPGKDFVSTDGGGGIRFLGPAKSILIEDCYVEGYQSNVTLQGFFGPISDVTVRRSTIVDAYSTVAHSQGLYAEKVHGLTLEENVFDHNGWNDDVPGAKATGFNHNVYIRADSSDVVVKGNIFARASSHGLQARAGGDIEDNLFIDNPVGMSFGLVNGSPATPGGVSGIVNGNVFIGGNSGDIDGTTRGWALEIANIKPNSGTTVSNNVFAGDGTGGDAPAIVVGVGGGVDNESQTVGINDLTIRGNVIYRWPNGIRVDYSLQPGKAGPNDLDGLTVTDNDFQRLPGNAVLHDAPFDGDFESWSDNTYDAGASGAVSDWKRNEEPSAKITKVNYLDPNRTVATYDKGLGGDGTIEDYLAQARKQSSQNWQAAYRPEAAIDYVHAGFAAATSAPTPTPSPTPTSTDPGTPSTPANNPEPPPEPRDWSAPSTPVASAHLGQDAQVIRGAATFTFDVTYIDPTGSPIDAATVDASDLHLVGPKKFDQPATPVSTTAIDGGGITVTYAVTTPGGTWQKGNAGAYTLSMNADQIHNAGGYAVEASDLSQFKLTIAKPPPPDKPPVVKKVKVTTKGAAGDSVALTFSEDVSASIDAGDLSLVAEDGTVLATPEQMAVTYDAAKNTATWTFPGLAGGVLPDGVKFRITLDGEGVTDAASQMLAGDKTGVSGIDYASVKWFKS